MAKSLLKEVSLQELQEMREQGMSNYQIAESLNCGYSTICRYLGRNPENLRTYGKQRENPHKLEEPQEPTPLLQTISRTVEMEGKNNCYTLYELMGVVRIKNKDGADARQFDKNGLETYIAELLDVFAMMK